MMKLSLLSLACVAAVASGFAPASPRAAISSALDLTSAATEVAPYAKGPR